MHHYLGFMVLQRSLGKEMQLNTAGVLAACRVHCASIKHVIWCYRGEKILHLSRSCYICSKITSLLNAVLQSKCMWFVNHLFFLFESCYFLLNPWETLMEDVLVKLFSKMLI